MWCFFIYHIYSYWRIKSWKYGEKMWRALFTWQQKRHFLLVIRTMFFLQTILNNLIQRTCSVDTQKRDHNYRSLNSDINLGKLNIRIFVCMSMTVSNNIFVSDKETCVSVNIRHYVNVIKVILVSVVSYKLINWMNFLVYISQELSR